jgi:16S rRNA pseudouridine516 synthase
MGAIRIDKYLADMRFGTRSEVKKLIQKGAVTLDGVVVKSPDCKVDFDAFVCVNGQPVTYQNYEYYMLNKPQGVVSATTDQTHQTVVALISSRKRKDLVPVGRLDIDTEGLLLITNDGQLNHALLSPSKHVDKCYQAVVLGAVTAADVAAFADGVDIGTNQTPELTLPAKLEIVRVLRASQLQPRVLDMVCASFARLGDKIAAAPYETQTVTEVLITIQEGRYHQVKRMFDTLQKPVLYLKRVQMGSLCLDETLAPGEYRELTSEELKELRLCQRKL